VAAHFADDAAAGTLAGLLPGSDVAAPRRRFGGEKTVRSWRSEGRTIFQYEWELEDAVTLRVNADESGRIERVAVALANPGGVNIPTLYGITLGRETYTSVQRKFGAALATDLQLWGAQGLYTVAQRLTFDDGRRLEFAYEMPRGLSRAELERVGNEVQHRRNPAVLDAYLSNRPPFMLALEEAR
jgi:hypothetical protein